MMGFRGLELAGLASKAPSEREVDEDYVGQLCLPPGIRDMNFPSKFEVWQIVALADSDLRCDVID